MMMKMLCYFYLYYWEQIGIIPKFLPDKTFLLHNFAKPYIMFCISFLQYGNNGIVKIRKQSWLQLKKKQTNIKL